MKTKLIFLTVIFSSIIVLAQTEQKNSLSGVLNIDSRTSFNQSQKISFNDENNLKVSEKSPWLAAGLSAVVPGAGEFYDESYIKSIAFIAIEAAAITVSVIYNKKGDDETNVFQNYADQNWSVVRYAKWTVTHANSINSGVDPTQYKVFYANGTVDWNELNRLEEAIGGYYSHKLPYHGEQQYYELIGKYPQYNVGWQQFGDDPNKAYTYGDPLVPQFHDYSEMRGKANDLYNVASKAIVVVVVNHIISAIDAAWSAHSYNKDLELHASLEQFNDGFKTVYYPQLNFKINF